MSLLDIGGGFSGRFDSHGHVMFGEIARTINAALSAHFPADAGVRVIAEPGRYFAETSAALLVPVYGKRNRWVQLCVHIQRIIRGPFKNSSCLFFWQWQALYAGVASACVLCISWPTTECVD